MINEGVCELASSCRQAATIRKHPSYVEHLTLGILFQSHLPYVIREIIEETWKQKIVEDYLNINLLSEFGCAKLIKGCLEEWILTIRCKSVTCNIKVQFSKHNKALLSLSVDTRHATSQMRMFTLANSAFYECKTMYSFVNITSSIFESGI